MLAHATLDNSESMVTVIVRYPVLYGVLRTEVQVVSIRSRCAGEWSRGPASASPKGRARRSNLKFC